MIRSNLELRPQEICLLADQWEHINTTVATKRLTAKGGVSLHTLHKIEQVSKLKVSYHRRAAKAQRRRHKTESEQVMHKLQNSKQPFVFHHIRTRARKRHRR